MTLIAEHHGQCPTCDDPIVPGQAIARTDDDTAWQHEVCQSMPDTAPCTCEKCWLVHAGECF